MEFQVTVHREEDAYWAEIPALPGCFASGQTLDELAESLKEAILMYLEDEPSAVEIEAIPAESPSVRVGGLTIEIPEAHPKVPA